jgi:hypothetical protein
MKFTGSLLLTLLITCSAMGASYYVSPTGSATNSGAITAPWSWAHAAANAPSGSVVYLRAGTYSGLTITAANVTFRSYLYERAKIDGTITASGSGLTLQGLEIFNSNAVTRTNAAAILGPGLNLTGVGGKAINLIVHDVGAPGIWMPIGATNSEVTGCVMWGIGLYQIDDGYSGSARGPIFYGQCNGANGDTRLIRDNIVSKSFTEGIKAYGESASAEGFTYQDNIAFWNAMDGYLLDTTSQAVTNFTMLGNVSYLNAYDRLGETEITRKSALIAGNTFIGDSTPYRKALSVHGWTNVTMTNNIFVDVTTNSAGWPNAADTLVFAQLYTTNAVQSYTVNANQFRGGTDTYGHWYTNGSVRLLWNEWKTLNNFDSSGSWSNTMPTANVVTVKANPYEAGRANIVVINWQGATTASASLANIGLVEGQSYEVRDVQNWFGTPCVRGIYHAATPNVTLPLNLTEVTPIAGIVTHFVRNVNSHTPTLFNTFVVLPSTEVVRVESVRATRIKKR